MDVADFAMRFAAVMIRMRNARDNSEGLVLESGEVLTLIEAMQVLRKGPE